jgi:tetratricopeptide (TPR) repeat protein
MKLSILALTFNLLAVGQEASSLIDVERQYRKTIAELEAGGPSIALSGALNGLAALYFEQHEYRRSELLCRRSLAIEQALPAPRQLEVARRLNNIAAVSLAQGKRAEGASLIRRALAIYEQLDAGGDQAIALNNLGTLELRAHQNAEAARHFAQAVNLLADQPADLAKTTANLAEAQSALGRTVEAIDSWSRALQVAEANGNANHRDYGAMLCLYAKTLARAGRKSQSLEVSRRGRAILDGTRSPAAYTVDRSDFR